MLRVDIIRSVGTLMSGAFWLTSKATNLFMHGVEVASVGLGKASMSLD